MLRHTDLHGQNLAVLLVSADVGVAAVAATQLAALLKDQGAKVGALGEGKSYLE
ncbi:hypothetical protein J2W40_003854 [Sphingobium xenophagum]|uniref:Uncharacterized protein n=2 Tax=Sphingobium xenophagum TaxID=121428 RepID=A0ABU1X7J4_SPHXE|nr:hypothetical protein [Sphingobium xenophagum]